VSEEAAHRPAVYRRDAADPEAIAEIEELAQVPPIRLHRVRRQAPLHSKALQVVADGIVCPGGQGRNGRHGPIVVAEAGLVNDLRPEADPAGDTDDPPRRFQMGHLGEHLFCPQARDGDQILQ